MAIRKTVPYDALLEFYDGILTDLGLERAALDSVTYGRFVSRLHSVACIDCPQFSWDGKGHAWVWGRPVPPQPKETDQES